MNRRWSGPIWIALLALVLAFSACGPDEELLAAEARAEAWGLIQQAHQELEEKRTELSEYRAKIEAGAEALAVEEGEDVEEAFAELQAKAESLAEEVADEAEDFGAELVGFINENPTEQGVEPVGEQLAAIRIKSSEDALTAMEWVNRGGDYKRAEDILERALDVDPNNEELKEKLAWVEDMRFITKERFEQLENGMTQDQVTELVGPVNLRNIKEFGENRLGWFYRKDPDEEGGAAGVFFQKKRGEWVVYQLDYEAIKAADE